MLLRQVWYYFGCGHTNALRNGYNDVVSKEVGGAEMKIPKLVQVGEPSPRTHVPTHAIVDPTQVVCSPRRGAKKDIAQGRPEGKAPCTRSAAIDRSSRLPTVIRMRVVCVTFVGQAGEFVVQAF